MENETTKRLLFLCTGNYYRSRFAEIFFNWHAPKLGLTWTADSRGLALDPYNPGPMSRYTVERLGRHGIPIEAYQRLPCDASVADFEGSHHVVAVKGGEHRPLMKSRFPAWAERIEYWEVHDIDCADPSDAMPHLEREVTALMERLAAGK